tara:strand:- start:235 stop:501 length:267 start_codon:yes stop_codon:yes gene_type:complete
MTFIHTPGPWVLRPNTDNQTAAIEPSKELLAQGRGGIAHVYKKDPLEEGYANQQLIAAAPDLLEALVEMVETQQVSSKAFAAIKKAGG